MKTMKAVVVVGKGDVKICNDIPIPAIGDYEVLCKVHACGLCSGTDFQIINGTLEEEAGFTGYPTVLGHESAGEVVAIGSKVRYIRLGNRCIHPNLHPDVGNGYKKAYGGMAEYGIGADYRAMIEDGICTEENLPFKGKFHLFPDSIHYIDAGMILSLSECLSAAKNFGVKKGDKVLFYGAGPMGTALAMFMRLLGAEKIVMIDGIEERLSNAARISKADQTVNFNKQSVKVAVGDEKFDLVVDAVGSSSILLEGSYFLRPGGTLCSLGVLKKADRELAVSRLQNNTRLHMLNQPYGEYAAMDETIHMILSGDVNPEDFYSHIVYFENISEALELVTSRKALKVILTFDQ